MPDSPSGGPVVEYLLKEVSFSTCDNKFFGELEKEMLIPNNVNIYGRISGADDLRDYRLSVEFPEATVVAYLKQPISNMVANGKRTTTYSLEDLINYEDYWWVPLKGQTEFLLALNLLPPFPQLNPVDLTISCSPDVAVGTDTQVTTRIKIAAQENIDNIFLTMSVPPFANRGVAMNIIEYSEDNVKEARQTITSPEQQFPFPRLSLTPGETKEYNVKTRIIADVPNMTNLKCQQEVLRSKLVVLSKSEPSGLPCSVSILNKNGEGIPVRETQRSTILQTQAQIMYSPFTMHREKTVQSEKKTIAPIAA